MASNDIAIKVDHVSKNFLLPHEKINSVKSFFVNPFKSRKAMQGETQHALKDISFEVKKGEFFGIVGRNGSGKSTLLKIIAGIYQPTKGTVRVNGRLVPFIELGVGFNPELTGRENVYLNGALMGFSEAEVDAMYDDIVKFAELEQFMDQKLKNYSSGMQVRLAFSVAIRSEADVLLIDEVLAVGDADFQRKCFEYFRRLKRDKRTVIFVSHDMSAVKEYCDRAILIEKSKIVHAGAAQVVAKEYTRLFLPSVYKAQLDGERVNRHNELRQSTMQNDHKWGAGGVDIRDIAMSKSVYNREDDLVELKYTVSRSKGFADEIIPGFTIKNEKGESICGTNSTILSEGALRINVDKSKTEVVCSWKTPNIFNSGKYTVDVAVLSATNSDTLVWWEDAVTFSVINEKDTPYPVTPRIEFEVR